MGFTKERTLGQSVVSEKKLTRFSPARTPWSELQSTPQGPAVSREPAAIVPARAIQHTDHAELDAPGAGPHGGGRPLPGRPDRGRRDMLHKTQVSQGSNQPVHGQTAPPKLSADDLPRRVGGRRTGTRHRARRRPSGRAPSALADSDAHCATVRGPTRTPKSAWSG